MNLGKIDMIKMFRNMVGCGLVDAKVACEIFLSAHGFSGIDDDNMRLMVKFISFMGAFVNKKVEMKGSPEGVVRLAWLKPNILTEEEVRNLS
jgi:hypothetical protein